MEMEFKLAMALVRGRFPSAAVVIEYYIAERERAAWDASQAATYRPVGPCHKTDNFAQYITFEEWKKREEEK